MVTGIVKPENQLVEFQKFVRGDGVEIDGRRRRPLAGQRLTFTQTPVSCADRHISTGITSMMANMTCEHNITR
jgi:hypothetical protein